MQRLVFSGGARFGFAKTGGGAWLALRAKIGSSVGVKLYQKLFGYFLKFPPPRFSGFGKEYFFSGELLVCDTS
ncbi:hypothetical protein IPP92_00850 [Candidatus Saccharibacteria bacterium]|nr:MAG: hypothetical protein IPP92_00850 [Candidatus Saccharibacteria bacterium]